MKILFIIKDQYLIHKMKNTISEDDECFFFNSIDEAYLHMILQGFPNIVVIDYSLDNIKILDLIDSYDIPPFLLITLFENYNEEIINNYYKNSYGDFFILTNNLKELNTKFKLIKNHINNNSKKYKDIIFNEIRNSIKTKDYEIRFSRLEFNLFRYLYLKQNLVVSRKDIQSYVWGFIEFDFFSRSVDTYIKLIRRKLNNYPDFKYEIVTSRGKGYSLVNKNK